MNIEFYTKKYNSEYISSRTNPKVVFYSKLSSKKYRDVGRVFLAEGIKLAAEAIKYAKVERLLVSAGALENSDIIDLLDTAKDSCTAITILSTEAFDKISTEKSPQGILAVVEYCDNIVSDNFESWQTEKRLIMLDEIRDPGNLGTILRSSEALGISGVILCNCADVYNSKTVRATMGTLYRLPIYLTDEGTSCIKYMKSIGRRVFGAALGEHNFVLGKYETNLTDCVVIGNEGHGISNDILNECDACVKIPMVGNTESMNAAQATACILWEYQRGL